MLTTLKQIRDKYQTPHYEAKNATLWVTWNLYSRFATPIVWLLLPTHITANQVTAGWVVLGVFSCYLFTLGNYWITILAALLIQFHITLDYVDGPIARIRNSSSADTKRGLYIERIGHDLIYTIYFYCLSLGAIKKGLEPAFILTFGFLASIGYFFYKYTRRAKIFCTLIYNANKNYSEDAISNRLESSKKESPNRNTLKVLYKNIQPIWDPINFTLITLLFALFDLVYVLPIFYGVTYPIHFVISYAYQVRIKDDWVYEWVKRL
jgi:hypothetical protein